MHAYFRHDSSDNGSPRKTPPGGTTIGIIVAVIGVAVMLVTLFMTFSGNRSNIHLRSIFSRYGVYIILAGILIFRAQVRNKLIKRQREEALERERRMATEVRDVNQPEIMPGPPAHVYPESEIRTEREDSDDPDVFTPVYDTERYEDHNAFRPRLRCYECGMSNEEEAKTCIQCGHKL